jgi:hypothetical protein
MTQLLKVQRPLIALVTLASVLSLGGAAAVSAADHDDRGRDGRDRYSYDHRYRDDYRGDRYSDRGWDRHDRGKKDKHYDRYRGDRYYGRYDGYYYDRNHDRRRFVVPHHLHHRDYRSYDRYYRGPVYYAPHHHQHRVYLFPVIIGGYTEYRPYAYCGEAYFPGHYGYAPYDGAHGHLGLHFSF